MVHGDPDGTTPAKHVLVTGACGLVGSAMVPALVDAGFRVTATDLDTAANRERTAACGTDRCTFEPADLTDPEAVEALLTTTEPDLVIHLAAIVPPHCYADVHLAEGVNVEAVAHLTDAACRLARPPRFLFASSVAVHGPRNPNRRAELLGPRTPTAPAEVYGAQKVAAEGLVRDSGLPAVVLRLGWVVDPRRTHPGDSDRFRGLLPDDGRIHTVDVRDVANAFVAAATLAPESRIVGRTLPIAGDDSHRRTQGELRREMAAAKRLRGSPAPTRPGDPENDGAWFATDWMDTAESQRLLAYQRHRWEDLLAEIRRHAGLRGRLARTVRPLLSPVLGRSLRRDPDHGLPGRYADPWPAIAEIWGDPARRLSHGRAR